MEAVGHVAGASRVTKQKAVSQHMGSFWMAHVRLKLSEYPDPESPGAVLQLGHSLVRGA